MSLTNLKKGLLYLSLLMVLVSAAGVTVRADENRRHPPKGNHCYDYDRNAGDDAAAYTDEEEKPLGDCPGNVPTPEPVSILLFSAGLAGVGFAARRRLRRSE